MRRPETLKSLETHKDELVEMGVKNLVILRSAARDEA
jgi:predicted nucleotidyltransferase